jgi:uncharacterized membrane protein YedE/YeeE
MTTKKSAAVDNEPTSGTQLALGFVFGIIFGFLLQKGGVAKYHILIGMLLLEDFTVVKVMLSAILVGMIGIFTMHRLGMVELHRKPTRYAANIIGGLLFGVGFALIGYCPGTGAAAVGQGNYDALGGVLGLMAGSFLYAEASAGLSRSVEKWGDCGDLTVPDMIGTSTTTFVLVFAPFLALVLIAIEQIGKGR